MQFLFGNNLRALGGDGTLDLTRQVKSVHTHTNLPDSSTRSTAIYVKRYRSFHVMYRGVYVRFFMLLSGLFVFSFFLSCLVVIGFLFDFQPLFWCTQVSKCLDCSQWSTSARGHIARLVTSTIRLRPQLLLKVSMTRGSP
jgi:hypothetical protein